MSATAAVSARPAEPSTKKRLIDEAERLFAQHGFDGISLREIAMAAGQGNTAAVQYHFKDKVGLIDAIFDDRVPTIESGRKEMWAALIANDRLNDPKEILKATWLPIVALTRRDGSHMFARLMMQYLIQPHVTRHPLARDLSSYPNSDRVMTALHKLHPHLSSEQFFYRLSILTAMFLVSVVEYDNTLANAKAKPTGGMPTEQLLTMALAALQAPG